MYRSGTRLEGWGGTRSTADGLHIEYWVRIEGALRGTWRIKPFLKSQGSFNALGVKLVRIDVWDGSSNTSTTFSVNGDGDKRLELSDLSDNDTGIVLFEVR